VSPDRCLLSVVSFFIKLTTSLDILEKPGKMIGRGELREQSWKYIESWKTLDKLMQLAFSTSKSGFILHKLAFM